MYACTEPANAGGKRRSWRMCRRKVRWRSSFPAELGPFRSGGISEKDLIIFARLFGLDSFSHQSSTSSTLPLRKEIQPRKSFTNLHQVFFGNASWPRTAMPFGGTCAPSSMLYRDLCGVVLRLHLPEEELDSVLHEAGDGHRTYAARNWGDH